MPDELTTLLKIGSGSVGGILIALAWLWLKRDKLHIDAKVTRDNMIDARDEIVYARMVRQLDWVNKIIEEQNQSSSLMIEEYTECREDFAEARMACHFLYDIMRAMHATMIAGGLNPPPLSEFPKLRERRNPATEFKMRETAQKLQMLKEQINNNQKLEAPGDAP